MIMMPTYEQFRRVNDDSKSYFEVKSRISDVNLVNETCTLTTGDSVTRNMPISVVVTDIYLNGMGVVSNPSALKNWRGFNK